MAKCVICGCNIKPPNPKKKKKGNVGVEMIMPDNSKRWICKPCTDAVKL